MIGVLALQGGFKAHLDALQRLGQQTIEVRKAKDLESCSALILPGGESTTMLKLIKAFDLKEPLVDYLKAHPALATCAGSILLSQEVTHPVQDSLGVLPVTIERNAYGSQRESFEVEIDVSKWNLKRAMVYFIRAPRFLKLGSEVEVLTEFEGHITGVTYRNLTAVTYHPELARQSDFHAAWLNQIEVKT